MFCETPDSALAEVDRIFAQSNNQRPIARLTFRVVCEGVFTPFMVSTAQSMELVQYCPVSEENPRTLVEHKVLNVVLTPTKLLYETRMRLRAWINQALLIGNITVEITPGEAVDRDLLENAEAVRVIREHTPDALPDGKPFEIIK